jgi:hypothetical protein
MSAQETKYNKYVKKVHTLCKWNGMITKGAELFNYLSREKKSEKRWKKFLICRSSIIQFYSWISWVNDIMIKIKKLTVDGRNRARAKKKSGSEYYYSTHFPLTLVMIIISNDHFREIITFLINPFGILCFSFSLTYIFISPCSLAHSFAHFQRKVIKSFNPISYSHSLS